MSVNVHVDTSGLVGWKRGAMTVTRRAAQRAGSSAITAMRTEATRAIRERKAMKLTHVRKGVIILPTDKQAMVWRIKASGEFVPVSAFGPRRTKKGVSVEINRGRRTIIRGAFLATMRSTHSGVFLRKGKARLPIKEAFTTTVANAFQDAIPRIATRGTSVFKATFERNIRNGAA